MRAACLVLFIAACSCGATTGPAAGTVVERRPATEGVALTSLGEPACEPVATCGCEVGCRALVRVTTASGERFRDADGTLWYRPQAGHPLSTVEEEACEEACRPEPARRRCAVIEGVCAEAP